jgi:hypothetical protein
VLPSVQEYRHALLLARGNNTEGYDSRVCGLILKHALNLIFCRS